jgi:lactate dehydrogenase-like 2-hydroxyacid dehydrogenase
MLESPLRPTPRAGRPTPSKSLSRGAHVFRIAMFSATSYDIRAFDTEVAKVNESAASQAQDGRMVVPARVEIVYIEQPLEADTIRELLPADTHAVCGFVNDKVVATVVAFLSEQGVKLMLNRCAGFNNVDVHAAEKHSVRVMRVPVYSPQSVAEHGVVLLMALNWKTAVAHAKCQELNFDLQGLEGF